MCLCDPRQIVFIIDSAFSGQVAADKLKGKIDVHIAARVYTRDNLNDTTQEGVASTR